MSDLAWSLHAHQDFHFLQAVGRPLFVCPEPKPRTGPAPRCN